MSLIVVGLLWDGVRAAARSRAEPSTNEPEPKPKPSLTGPVPDPKSLPLTALGAAPHPGLRVGMPLARYARPVARRGLGIQEIKPKQNINSAPDNGANPGQFALDARRCRLRLGATGGVSMVS